jgi:hypothetical protein
MATQWDTMHASRRAELEAQGVPPHIAMEQAAMETIRARQAQVAATIPRDADGRPSLDDDEAAFDASMADAMGQSNLAAAATPLQMEPEFGRSSRPTPVYRRAPGPVDYGTGESEAGEDIYSEKEAAAYRYRKPRAVATDAEVAAASAPGSPYRGGAYLPSPEDLRMWERGMVETYNPETGARGYSVAYVDPQAGGIPGDPGRLGDREDLRRPVRDVRTGQRIPGTQNYVPTDFDSPLGRVQVYRPSPEFREQLDAQAHRKLVERLGRAAGLSDAEILAMASGEAPVDLEALRSAGRLRREAGREERLAEVSRRAMERQNPTALLNDEWRQFVIANRLLGGNRAGASPSDVQARNLEAAFRLAQSQNLGGRGNEAAEVLADRRQTAEQERMTQGRRLAATVLSMSDTDPTRRRQAASRLLLQAGYSGEEARAILDDLFATAPPPPEVPPGAPQPGRPGGIGDMGQGFSM